MKTYKPSPCILCLLAVFSLSITPAFAADKATDKKPALSANDMNDISKRIQQTGDQMRADLKKARQRFDAQEVERKQAAERARVQAIRENEQRQAQKIAQARQQQLAAKAQAERQRQEAEQARLQAERKKQMVLVSQTSKEAQAADLQARKERAAEALRKMRASSEPKAF